MEEGPPKPSFHELNTAVSMLILKSGTISHAGKLRPQLQMFFKH